MKIFAHRGYSAKYPENTMSAFRVTASLPIDGVEFDVHLTKDKKIVVIHDETIDRTSNGSGFVKDFTLDELRAYDFGSWFNEQFAGEMIPTLGDVLDVFSDTQHIINIELKSDVFVYAGLEELVVQEVESRKLSSRVILSSFDHEAVQKVAQIAPNIENAALYLNPILYLVEYQSKILAKAIHIAFPVVPRRPVLEAINACVPIRAYTVNETQYIDSLLTFGVDAIFTDQPEKMHQYLLGKR